MRKVKRQLMEKVINRLLIVILAAAVIFGTLAYRFKDAEHDSAYREALNFSLCEYIDIELKRLDVTVMPYDGDLIAVSYTSDLPLAFNIGDNRLTITESEKFMISLFTGSETKYGLNLLLPHKVFREVSIYTGTGNVEVGRVDSGVISVITNTGDISCGNTVSRVSLTTSTGEISLDIDEVMGGSDIFSRNGNVNLSFPKKSSVKVNFETETGMCNTDLWGGSITGSYSYGFNGGERLINATLNTGVLNINEKG